MRTLFSDAILSPVPTPTPTAQPNPFELPFQSTSYTTSSGHGTNSTVSSSRSTPPTHNDYMTRYRESQRQHADEVYTQNNIDAAARYGHTRRKGNPKVLLMGARRSGKSSIQKVLFEKFSPTETLYLDATTKIETATMNSFMKFESAEVPINIPYLTPDFDRDSVFGTAGAVVWVIDIQDEYFNSISQLIQTASFLLETYPRINLEVFIHKTDGLSEEYKFETYRDVRQRVQDELSDAGFGNRGVAFYQTSIFDHSVYEAMSKVVQKLLPQLPALEALLNKLCASCRIQKAYLFDTTSKIYLATDASPTFLKDYEVCSDYVDVIVDIKQLYSWQTRGGQQKIESTSHEEGGEPPSESLITYDKSGNTYIFAREINDYLALICVMGQGSTADKRVLIDYNVSILQDALQQMFKL